MLIGRSSERQQVAELLAHARVRRSSALVVVGDPGVGKSTLLDDAVDSATGFRVLRATGYEIESNLPFAGLSATMAPLTQLIPTIPAPQAAALTGALGLGDPTPAGDRFTVYAGALSVLAEAALPQPLLVIVDDGHWMDPASVDAFCFVARRIVAEGIVMLMASRDDPTTLLRRAAGITQLRLEGLPSAAAAELVAGTAGRLVSASTVARLIAETGGNPLALIEGARELRDQRAAMTGRPDPAAGSAIADMYVAQAAALGEDTRWALTIAAAGHGAPLLVADALAAEGVSGSLDAAVAQRLMIRTGERVAFRHPLIRSGIYHSASDVDRRAAHRVLAERATERGETMLAARHHASAVDRPNAEVADALYAAGHAAAGRMGYVEAAEVIGRSATLTPDAAVRASRFVEAGAHAALAGQIDLARRNLDEEGMASADPHVRTEARRLGAHIDMWTGNVSRAREVMLAEAERAAADDPASGLDALVDVALATMMAGLLQESTELLDRMAKYGTAPAQYAGVASIARAMLAVMAGRADANAFIASVPEDPLALLSSSDPFGWTRVCPVIQLHFAAGHPRRGLAFADRLVGIGRLRGAPSMLPFPLAARSEILYLVGNWSAALASAQESSALAYDTGQVPMAVYADTVIGRIACARGDQLEANIRLDHVLTAAEGLHYGCLALIARASRGFLELAVGRPDRAVDHLEPLVAWTRTAGLRCNTMAPFVPDLVEAAVRCERLEVTADAIDLLTSMDLSGVAQTQGALERCRGLVAQDADQAAAHFRAAIAHEVAAEAPFEVARSRLLLGERLLHGRARKDAREPLQRAHTTFALLGATPWAERAAAGLGLIRARPRIAGSSLPALTPQEQQVAEMAALGLTNKEIAAQLFLSVKTVEFHLHNTYAKVGVRSRTELSSKLRGNVESDPDDL